MPGCEEEKLHSALPLAGLGPDRILWSTAALSSYGMLLESHIYLPGQRKSAAINKHVISMSTGLLASFEYRDCNGNVASGVIRPKTITLVPAGLGPDVCFCTLAELIHCALADEFVQQVAEELGRPIKAPQFRPMLEDKSIRRILDLLLDEREAEFPLGRLYVDSLVYALATRYLLHDIGETEKPKSQIAGLLPRILRRVRTRIEVNLDKELSLESLAEESGYSRAHFFRLFRQATGFTPYEYVLDLRLKRAQELLREANSSIIDVALSCGFSSQSHMTSVFRRHLATTPGRFRRHPAKG